jgi:hypothetical protein
VTVEALDAAVERGKGAGVVAGLGRRGGPGREGNEGSQRERGH